MQRAWFAAFAVICLLFQNSATPVLGQDAFPGLFEVEQKPALQGLAPKEATVEAALRPTDKPGVVQFELTLTIPEGANSYSQSKDFAKPTVIKLSNIKGWTALDDKFAPKPKPKKQFDELFNKEVEKLVGTTVFSRRYLAPQGTDIRSARFSGTIDFLLCDAGSCTPQSEKFVAEFTAEKKSESESNVSELFAPPGEVIDAPTVQIPSVTSNEVAVDGPFKYGYEITPQRKKLGAMEGDPVRLGVQLTPADFKVGDEVTLSLQMKLLDDWHTYGLKKAETQIELPTVIKLKEVSGLKELTEFKSTPAPEPKTTEFGTSNVHADHVTFSKTFRVTNPSEVGIQGTISYQICKTSCLPPNPILFSLGTLQLPADIANARPILESAMTSTSEAESQSEGDSSEQVASSESESPLPVDDLFASETEGEIESLGLAIPLAFLGGLLLNVMPCVLPVLAIKILSLVQQAGESRLRVLSLNLSYTAGVLLVFLILAVVSTAIGWGGQFQNENYVIVMTLVVFAMGLSLLGVFELPVPGLVPSANEHSEGLVGAFNTGIIATLLATPCTGPFMGVVIAFASKQPTAVNFLIFATMGLGMASPYVLAGFFPRIVNWLPKPGMWMVRFKQFSGFVLMGTVIWLMATSLGPSYHIPVLILLLGVALLLWMVGLAPASGKAIWGKPLLTAVLVAGPVIAAGFYGMPSSEMLAEQNQEQGENNRSDVPVGIDEMPWETFSEERMVELRQQGVPMLIDFTADWCNVCKQNELWALNRTETVEFVRKHGVVPMVADFTREDPEIRKWLERFGVVSVPLTVIFPADVNEKAVAIPGPYTMDGIISRLEKAVTSSDENVNSEKVSMKSDDSAL
ncbi:Thiol:disulfide interchange protein DsbD precursor [Thalassoglobus neptunius]|uniref:Thiol:disulfide interchange protein DsbD n=1 Tax=Thalassoglobus neptunius TaxID=1938619 RepID=A0A5C5WZF0_9PLAN|nr:protein-disulfide reductase DsbD [Thalassoglobus neptunius]TWT55302.1 Thiol:disulfide interchange protein DsbD precursor [Thalassoglobus neptunius]